MVGIPLWNRLFDYWIIRHLNYALGFMVILTSHPKSVDVA